LKIHLLCLEQREGLGVFLPVQREVGEEDSISSEMFREFSGCMFELVSAKSGSDSLGNFPEEEWISLRTTNIVERLNKEFQCRTKPILPAAGRGNYCWGIGLL
jgi:hypothetical protein